MNSQNKKNEWRISAILSEIGIDRPSNMKDAIDAWRRAAELGDEWAVIRLKQLQLRAELKQYFVEEDYELVRGVKRYRFLVAEDDIAVRQEITNALVGAGHKVSQAQDGEEALLYLANEPIFAVVLDLKLPKKDGFAILAEIKRLSLPVKIIVCTGYANQENLEKMKSYNVSKVIIKPFFREDIVEAARLVLK